MDVDVKLKLEAVGAVPVSAVRWWILCGCLVDT